MGEDLLDIKEATELNRFTNPEQHSSDGDLENEHLKI